MKFTTSFLALLASVASGAPVIEERQSTRVGATSNEFSRGGCNDVIFFFARGSTEIGNMGTICGPPTGEGLKKNFGGNKVAVEGIDYAAALSTNFLRGGADPVGIAAMRNGVLKAVADCPDSTILVSGYSQGAAVVHRAVENMPADARARIAGIVTFGDTQNQQDKEQVPNFPPEKTKIICNRGDAVCVGTLTILAPHLTYGARADEAVQFLTSMVNQDKAARKVKV